MKTCTKCKVEKSLDNYYILKKIYYSSWCKQCVAEYRKSDKSKAVEKEYHKSKNHKLHNKSWMYKKQGIYGWFDGNISLYIGQSKRLNGRISSHKSWFKNPMSAPKGDWELYIKLNQHPNASIRIIEECSPEILLERERHYINNYKPLYNKK